MSVCTYELNGVLVQKCKEEVTPLLYFFYLINFFIIASQRDTLEND